MRVPKDLLYDVITNTILLDNLLTEIIKTSFGLENEWDPETYDLLNEKSIERFERFFMQELSASAKMNLIKEIIKEDFQKKITLPKDFDKKFIRFYKIRNIFAHSLYPKHIDAKEIPRLLPSDASWEDLHKEHSLIFAEINDFLINNLYQWLANSPVFEIKGKSK